MIRRKTTIFLLATLCLGYMGGGFSVVCHGSDGHIELEPIGHTHCDSEDSHHEHSDGANETFEVCHGHQKCSDTAAIPGILAPSKIQDKVQLFSLALRPSLISISKINISPLCTSACGNNSQVCFFTPLETIVLLA